jgi:hypothetical protein
MVYRYQVLAAQHQSAVMLDAQRTDFPFHFLPHLDHLGVPLTDLAQYVRARIRKFHLRQSMASKLCREIALLPETSETHLLVASAQQLCKVIQSGESPKPQPNPSLQDVAVLKLLPQISTPLSQLLNFPDALDLAIARLTNEEA